jgi:hypothetical protein
VIEKFIKKLMMQYESLHPKESEVIKPVASRQKRVENPTIISDVNLYSNQPTSSDSSDQYEDESLLKTPTSRQRVKAKSKKKSTNMAISTSRSNISKPTDSCDSNVDEFSCHETTHPTIGQLSRNHPQVVTLTNNPKASKMVQRICEENFQKFKKSSNKEDVLGKITIATDLNEMKMRYYADGHILFLVDHHDLCRGALHFIPKQIPFVYEYFITKSTSGNAETALKHFIKWGRDHNEIFTIAMEKRCSSQIQGTLKKYGIQH